DNACHHNDAQGQNQREPPELIQRQVGHIHAVEAEEDIGDGEQNGDGGQHLHDDVQVVGDDGGKGVHHTGNDGGVDIGHLNSLAHLDEHVLQQVVVLLIKGDDAAPEDL